MKAVGACVAVGALAPARAEGAGSPMVLGNDLVLAALIGKRSAGVEKIIGMAERGEVQLVVFDLSLFCAFSSVRPSDRVDYPRFAKLLRVAEIRPSLSRGPHGLEPPSAAEITHWRNVVFGIDD